MAMCLNTAGGDKSALRVNNRSALGSSDVGANGGDLAVVAYKYAAAGNIRACHSLDVSVLDKKHNNTSLI
jgi:hypothetical protein